jgi:hypothetical protein
MLQKLKKISAKNYRLYLGTLALKKPAIFIEFVNEYYIVIIRKRLS